MRASEGRIVTGRGAATIRARFAGSRWCATGSVASVGAVRSSSTVRWGVTIRMAVVVVAVGRPGPSRGKESRRDAAQIDGVSAGNRAPEFELDRGSLTGREPRIPRGVRRRRGPPPHSTRSRRARLRCDDVHDGARLNARGIAKTLTLISAWELQADLPVAESLTHPTTGRAVVPPELGKR